MLGERDKKSNNDPESARSLRSPILMLNHNLYTCISKFMKLYGAAFHQCLLFIWFITAEHNFHSFVKDGALHVVNVNLDLFLVSFWLVCIMNLHF